MWMVLLLGACCVVLLFLSGGAWLSDDIKGSLAAGLMGIIFLVLLIMYTMIWYKDTVVLKIVPDFDKLVKDYEIQQLEQEILELKEKTNE